MTSNMCTVHNTNKNIEKLQFGRNDKHPSHIENYLYEWKFRANKKSNLVVYVNKQQFFFVVVGGARAKIPVSLEKKASTKKNRSHSFGKLFSHILFISQSIFAKLVCCCYLLSIVLTHNEMSMCFSIVWKHFICFYLSKWQTYFIHGHKHLFWCFWVQTFFYRCSA